MEQETLCIGMIVRVPFDREQEDHREFRIGRVHKLHPERSTATILFEHHQLGDDPEYDDEEIEVILLSRCDILPHTNCIYIPSQKPVRVLIGVDDKRTLGQPREYFVESGDVIQRVSETELVVPSHRQDPNPIQQMLAYELQNPSWRFPRDHFVTTEAEMRAVTFGLEDLISTRVLLLMHQADVIARALTDEYPRYLLADEVGLGKTIEACVILKGLRHRKPELKTLIIAPNAVLQQWYYELDQKFWLRFPKRIQELRPETPGLLLSTETLEQDEAIWNAVNDAHWDLLIIDEAHHVRKRPILHARLQTLSEHIDSLLLLSATPIQRRVDELFTLLKLLNPSRYNGMDQDEFSELVAAQEKLRSMTIVLKQLLSPQRFSKNDVMRQLNQLRSTLSRDLGIEALINEVEQASSDASALIRTEAVVNYVSTNYRLEANMIRNRRANINLDGETMLPAREVITRYAYSPQKLETDTFEVLYDYLDTLIEENDRDPLALEWARLLLYAASSSPVALKSLIETRSNALENPTEVMDRNGMLQVQVGVGESERISAVARAISTLANEMQLLQRIHWAIEAWVNEQSSLLENTVHQRFTAAPQDRLVQVVRAVTDHLREFPKGKVLIFSAWSSTLVRLYDTLRKLYGSDTIAQFHVLVHPKELQSEVNKFQSVERCRIMLSDELGGEGRNFQHADLIIHVDLPWTPAQVEQRIGRVDRLGRTGKVLSCVIYAHDFIDHDLFRLWQDGLNLFTQSMSGMEIALQDIQDRLMAALARDSRSGLAQLLKPITQQAEQLREYIEEERYFESSTINREQRNQFRRMREKYEDGAILREAVHQWSSIAGLTHYYDSNEDTVTFQPKQFNFASMKNAKIVHLPDMTDAADRSGRARKLQVKGTFNRRRSVRYEDWVFFAPSGEPWTEAIMSNAFEADRGRCCAIRRKNSGVTWSGFDFLFTIHLNPRPLYQQNLPTTHLFRAQGYLHTAAYRILVSTSGTVIPHGDPLYKVVEPTYFKQRDDHLGQRQHGKLAAFMESYPQEQWQVLVNDSYTIASQHLREQLSFTDEVAEDAQYDFERQRQGMSAAAQWLTSVRKQSVDNTPLLRFFDASSALVEAIRTPLIRLESACFWILE